MTPLIRAAFFATMVLATSTTVAAAASGYELIVSKGRWSSLGLGYRAEPAMNKLKALTARDELFTIGVGQIDSVDWDRLVVALTPAATTALAKSLDVRDRSLGSALSNLAFIVRLNGEYRFGGIFLDAVSQMAIDFPVARASVVSGRAQFAFLPVQISFAEEDPVDAAGQRRPAKVPDIARADIDQLRSKEDKAFDKWFDGMAMSPNAQAFRALLRADDLRAALAAAGKLR